MGFFGPDLTDLKNINLAAMGAFGNYRDAASAATAGSREAADKLKQRMAGTEFLAGKSLQDLQDYYAGREYAPSYGQTMGLARAQKQSRFTGGLGNSGFADTSGRKFTQQQNVFNRELSKSLGQTSALAREERFKKAGENYAGQLGALTAADLAGFKYLYENPMSYQQNVLNASTVPANIANLLAAARQRNTENKLGFGFGLGSTALGLAFPGAGGLGGITG